MGKVPPTFEAGARAEGWRGLRLAALCVGVGAYAKHAKLGNTVRDAEAVYHAVNACAGCRAAIIRDPPDKKTIRTHLRAFLEELAPTGANGAPPETVLLFVAGHGVQRGHHVYLIPTAAASDDETDLVEDCLSHLTLFEWLHRFLDAPAKDAQPKRFDVKFAVILDVCREPAAVADAQSGQVLASIEPERGAAPERWALCYSTSRGSVALDGDAGSHSPLALGMLDARSGICAPGVALKHGIENACAAVRESTRQRPITVTLDVLGDFVLQPGPDREVPPGFSGTLSRNPRPSGRCLRVFLGYRVDSDQDLVERLYDKLKSEGIDVWWDARCLPPGQPWEEGFADGLCSSDVFVPVISKAALAPFASLTPESRCDNVLLEHQLALELKMRGNLHCIYPVFVGVLRHDGELGEMYGDFFKGGGIPNCPEVIVGSVEAKLSEHLFRKGKGVPQLPDAQRKVAGTLTAIKEHQGVMLSGIRRDAFQKVVDGIVHACGAHRASPFVQHESAHTRARESDKSEAGDPSKMAKADTDSRFSKAAGKRSVDTSESSPYDAKKAKQDSASASAQESGLVGGAGIALASQGAGANSLSSVSTTPDSDCNELVRFLTGEGLKAIALRFSEAMGGMELIRDFETLQKEDLDDPDLSFLKRWQKDKLLRLTTGITAHACNRGLNDSELSGDDTSSDSERDDRTEYMFDTVLAKHPGSPAQFEAHISGFLKSMLWSAPETATETFHVPFEGHSHELSYCMLVWMCFAKEACPEGLLRDKWLECIKTATQDRLLTMLETCLQQGSTCHKCWIRADFKRLNCTKPYAAAIFVTEQMVRHSLWGHAESVQKWQQDVVKNWFQNGEEASAFLFRANYFLRQHILNGTSVVNKVIETQSYVAFMRMTRLASLLLFEYLEARKLQAASAPGAAGSSSSLFQGFRMFISSSKCIFSLTPMDVPARHARATVLQGLRCLSRLSMQAWEMMGPVRKALEFAGEFAEVAGKVADIAEMSARQGDGLRTAGSLERGKVHCWGKQRVVGLCVGIDDYSHQPKIRNAVNDAVSVATKLKKIHRCYAEVLSNPKTGTELLRWVRRCLEEPDLRKNPPEIFWFYYAGHGIMHQGKMWLLPVHANIQDADDLKREGVSLNELMEYLRKYLDEPVRSVFGTDKAIVFLVVVDACRGNLDVTRGLDDGQSLEPRADKAPHKWKILYSCSRNKLAGDGRPGGHGPFAQAMLNEDEGFFTTNLTLGNALQYVSKAVKSTSDGQAPTELGQPDAIPSSFCINPRSDVWGSVGVVGGADTGKAGIALASQGAGQELRGVLQSIQSQDGFGLPAPWQERGCLLNFEARLVECRQGSRDYDLIKARMEEEMRDKMGTLPTVLKVEMNANVDLLRRYDLEKKKVAGENDGDANEVWLWHATRSDDAERSILKHGFDLNRCGLDFEYYGAGIYLVPDCKFANRYAARGPTKSMLLVRVACGKVFERAPLLHSPEYQAFVQQLASQQLSVEHKKKLREEKTRELLRMPKNRSCPDGYHSQLGVDISGSRKRKTEVVVNKNFQAYPAYRITYSPGPALSDPLSQEGKEALKTFDEYIASDWHRRARDMLL